MTAIHMADYGLTGPFAALAHSCPPGRQAARIISQEKGFYHIVCENGERLASVSGCSTGRQAPWISPPSATLCGQTRMTRRTPR